VNFEKCQGALDCLLYLTLIMILLTVDHIIDIVLQWALTIIVL